MRSDGQQPGGCTLTGRKEEGYVIKGCSRDMSESWKRWSADGKN